MDKSPEDTLNDLLGAQLSAERQELTHEEWVHLLEARGERNAGKNLPILSSEELRRENLYEDRGL